jgi:hypothetical protein
MSNAALEWAGRFDWEVMARETLELIDEAVRRGPAGRKRAAEGRAWTG